MLTVINGGDTILTDIQTDRQTDVDCSYLSQSDSACEKIIVFDDIRQFG